LEFSKNEPKQEASQNQTNDTSQANSSSLSETKGNCKSKFPGSSDQDKDSNQNNEEQYNTASNFGKDNNSNTMQQNKQEQNHSNNNQYLYQNLQNAAYVQPSSNYMYTPMNQNVLGRIYQNNGANGLQLTNNMMNKNLIANRSMMPMNQMQILNNNSNVVPVYNFLMNNNNANNNSQQFMNCLPNRQMGYQNGQMNCLQNGQITFQNGQMNCLQNGQMGFQNGQMNIQNANQQMMMNKGSIVANGNNVYLLMPLNLNKGNLNMQKENGSN